MPRFVFAICALIGLAAFAPAQAATTVFGASVFSQSGQVLNAGNALGAADGTSAGLGRPSTLVLTLDAATSGAGMVINGVKAGPSTQVRISVGEIVGGTAVFTATQNFPNGGGPATFDFAADCALISATGCSLVQIVITGAPSAFFSLDGLSGVSAAPEPRIWALMVLGFLIVALRLKVLRRNGHAGAAIPARMTAN